MHRERECEFLFLCFKFSLLPALLSGFTTDYKMKGGEDTPHTYTHKQSACTEDAHHTKHREGDKVGGARGAKSDNEKKKNTSFSLSPPHLAQLPPPSPPGPRLTPLTASSVAYTTRANSAVQAGGGGGAPVARESSVARRSRGYHAHRRSPRAAATMRATKPDQAADVSGETAGAEGRGGERAFLVS